MPRPTQRWRRHRSTQVASTSPTTQICEIDVASPALGTLAKKERWVGWGAAACAELPRADLSGPTVGCSPVHGLVRVSPALVAGCLPVQPVAGVVAAPVVAEPRCAGTAPAHSTPARGHPDRYSRSPLRTSRIFRLPRRCPWLGAAPADLNH